MSYQRILTAVALLAGSLAITASAQAQSFSYPATNNCTNGCRGFGHQGRFHQVRAKLDHFSMVNERVRKRNDAWPKPFACYDRQAYHGLWNQMLMVGNEQRCLLSDAAFDAQTNELTSLGISQVADIMESMPNPGRTVFVQQNVDDSVNQKRMEKVKFTIDRYYAHKGTARILLSNQVPHVGPASESEMILQGRIENRPAPAIQASTGGSVAQEVGN